MMIQTVNHALMETGPDHDPAAAEPLSAPQPGQRNRRLRSYRRSRLRLSPGVRQRRGVRRTAGHGCATLLHAAKAGLLKAPSLWHSCDTLPMGRSGHPSPGTRLPQS